MFVKIKNEIKCIGKLNLIIGALMFVLIALIVRLCCDSPYIAYKLFDMSDFAPPLWLIFFLWMIFYAISGVSFVGALLIKGGLGEIYKYKGGMFLIIMTALSFAWYPAFFNLKALFFSFLIGVLTCIFSFCACICYYRVSSFIGTLMLFDTLWLIYAICINLIAVFHSF